jgi:ubiquinol-cytochrome c reductase iron-sulfur subunit
MLVKLNVRKSVCVKHVSVHSTPSVNSLSGTGFRAQKNPVPKRAGFFFVFWNHGICDDAGTQLTAKGSTSTPGINPGRRRFLVAATSVVGAAGTVGAAIPFVASLSPGAAARAAGAPVRINVGKLEPGQQMVAQWRGQPVFVLRRGSAMLASLDKVEPQLADPQSLDSVQPGYVDGRLRSIKPEILLVVGICTHLGCSPTFRPQIAPVDLGAEWVGGYFCPCHGSRYDLAGRVYKAQPAPLNLSVPPHAYESADIIVIGIDQEQA